MRDNEQLASSANTGRSTISETIPTVRRSARTSSTTVLGRNTVVKSAGETHTLLLAAVALSLLAFLSSQLSGSNHTLGRAYLALSLCCSVYVVASAIVVKEQRPLALASSLFMSVFITLPALFQCAEGHFPFYALNYNDEIVSETAWMWFVFNLIFATSITARTTSDQRNVMPQLYDRQGEILRIYKLLPIYLALSFATVLVYGHEAFTTRRIEIEEALGNKDPLRHIFEQSGRSAAAIAFIAAVAVALRVPRLSHILIAVVLAPVFVFFNNPFNVPRFVFLGWILALVFVCLNFATVRIKSVFVFAYIGAMLTVFPALSQFSRGREGDDYIPLAAEYFTTHGDLDGFQSMINIKTWIDTEGLQWGRQLTAALFVFIPRSVWPTKGEGTGGVAAQFAGYRFINISAPIAGELYSDFGWGGVIVGAAGLGWSLQRFDRAANKSHRLGSVTGMIPFAVASSFAGIIIRGSLVGVIANTALAILMGSAIRAVGERPR